MLSDKNIYDELGKNIFIYPKDHLQVKGNSIDFSASEFAWTYEKDKDGNYAGRNICDGDIISIPPYTTAYIVTNECVYVTGKIGGTYHSKIGILKKGLSSISTTLDPYYIGQSLIIIYNQSDGTIDIRKNEPIVSLMFYYLSKPTKKDRINANPAHNDFISKLDASGKYQSYLEKNKWAKVHYEIEKIYKDRENPFYLDDFHKEVKRRKWLNILKRSYRYAIGFAFAVIIITYLSIVPG